MMINHEVRRSGIAVTADLCTHEGISCDARSDDPTDPIAMTHADFKLGNVFGAG